MHKDGRGTSGRTPAWCGHRGSIAAAIFLLWFGWALPSSAHEEQVWQIGDTHYLVRIGFLDDTALINDKTAVSLVVMTVDPDVLARRVRGSEAGDLPAELPKGAKAMPFLNRSLKAEVSAGGQGNVLTFEGIYPPLQFPYRAYFVPTDPGPYQVRIFGTIAGTPIDVTTSCTPLADHNQAFDLSPPRIVSEEISPGVVRTFINGAFLCPRPRGPLEIPEPSYVTAARRAAEAPPPAAPPKQEPGLTFDLRVLYLGLGGLAALAAVAGLTVGIRLLIRRLRRSSAPPSY